MNFPRLAALPLLLALAAAPLGCSAQLIPNTDVEDTEHNRTVVEFCEVYRKAVERRDVRKLIAMAHPTYYEDGGSSDTSDDIDLAGLREHLETKFKGTTAIRHEIRYRRVSKGRGDHIYVDYTYSAGFRIALPGGDQWRRAVADNRLELVPDGETFKILSGM